MYPEIFPVNSFKIFENFVKEIKKILEWHDGWQTT